MTSESAFSFAGYPFAARQAASAVLSSGTWTLSEASSCASTSWSQVATQLANPVAEPSSLAATASTSQVLAICEHGGRHLAVRGWSRPTTPRAGRSPSTFCLEEYVQSVTSAEVSWSWGLFGGNVGSPQGEPWGFQALEAQAVATRSYTATELAAGGWKPYATTCDSYCQSYPGMVGDTADVDAAVADTAGQILEEPGRRA